VEDVNDLRQYQIDMWAGVEQSIIGDATSPCLHSSYRRRFWL